jgi:hypothetical protein
LGYDGRGLDETSSLFCFALLSGLAVTSAAAECHISDAKLEEAVLQNPHLRDPSNRQMVLDLRDSYDVELPSGHH